MMALLCCSAVDSNVYQIPLTLTHMQHASSRLGTFVNSLMGRWRGGPADAVASALESVTMAKCCGWLERVEPEEEREDFFSGLQRLINDGYKDSQRETGETLAVEQQRPHHLPPQTRGISTEIKLCGQYDATVCVYASCVFVCCVCNPLHAHHPPHTRTQSSLSGTDKSNQGAAGW